MLPSNCTNKSCPGWLGALIVGMMAYVVITIMFMKDVMAQEVVVSFERELPYKTFYFTRTFEDKDAFEMWLSDRLETKGCDPYLKNMNINFSSNKDFPATEQ